VHISRLREGSERLQAMGFEELKESGKLSRNAFDELTPSRTEANDKAKINIVSTEIPIIKEIASQENQPEEKEQQALEEAHIEPTSLAQSRAKRTIKPSIRYIEACFQEAIESNER